MNENKPIILFDGVCNLCNSSVQFVLKRDKQGLFRFASLQSDAGRIFLERHGLPTDDFNSFILVEGEKVYSRSTAALKVTSRLDGGWKLLGIFWVVPSFIRDIVYDFIAKNRYRFFGKREHCMLPRPEWKDRFLD